MSLINVISDAIFGKDASRQKSSIRESAKQRLHLVLINDRAGQNTPDFLPKLRAELVEVLKKYIPVSQDEDIEFQIARKEETQIMEISISLDNKDDAK